MPGGMDRRPQCVTHSLTGPKVNRFVLICVTLLAGTAHLDAQIYTWRDASGAPVYSDRPRPGGGDMATLVVGDRRGAAAGEHRRHTTTTRPATLDGPTTTNRPALANGADIAHRPAAPGRFDDIIERHAAANGLSPDLIRAVIQVESGFDPRAVSPKGAQGLMQLMPDTARELGVVDAFRPEENIRGGVAYLKHLLGQYGQDLRLALAAYNAGPASVSHYGDVPPYRETQAYVRKVTAATRRQAEGEDARPPGQPRTKGGTSTPAPSPDAPRSRIYRWTETIDGRAVPRYSDKPPAGRGANACRVAAGIGAALTPSCDILTVLNVPVREDLYTWRRRASPR